MEQTDFNFLMALLNRLLAYGGITAGEQIALPGVVSKLQALLPVEGPMPYQQPPPPAADAEEGPS